MTFQTLLLIAAAGGVLRLLVVRPTAWCTRRAAILEGRVFVYTGFTWAVLLFFLGIVLIYRVSLWRPVSIESQGLLVVISIAIGWHLSANAANALILAFISWRDLAALDEGQKRLKRLLENLPAEEIRLDGENLVLLQIFEIRDRSGFGLEEALSADQIKELKEEGRWNTFAFRGFELHYEGGLLRQQLGPLPACNWLPAPGSAGKLGVRETLNKRLMALALTCALIEAAYPGSDKPKLGPPRFPLLER